MKNSLAKTKEILNSVSGFHQYVLTEPFRLDFASSSLCAMLGAAKDELLSDSADLYARFVHPSDREGYLRFLEKMAASEQSGSARYRLIGKDGRVIYVSDSFTSVRLEDGSMAGRSVLTDITDLKNENNQLRFINESIPCGFLKYTCEKQPKITYINDRMLKILRFPEKDQGEIDYFELFKDNIYLMVPMEERRRLAVFLERVYKKGAPAAGDISVLRCDGTKARLFGWALRCVDEQGREEFQSFVMDITEVYRTKKENDSKRYLRALCDVYDKIFEYDKANGTVKCLYGQKSDMFRWIENIPMQMEEATEKWISGTVAEDDRERVRDYFRNFYKNDPDAAAKSRQIKYRAMSSSGRLKTYSGIFLDVEARVSLFCCRSLSDEIEADALRDENESLKNINENMQKLVMSFTDGIAAFEVAGDLVTPLYESDNVCSFFGYSKEEWLSLMKKSTPLEEFVSRSSVSYENFSRLLENGEAEFKYYDLYMKTTRRIKAICSQRSKSGSSPRYVMLYNLDNHAKEGSVSDQSRSRVYIRTFGYFDVFVDDKAIAFRNEKSKELFALLVDRRGGYVSSEEAISFLWEDECASPVTLARYRKVALRLKNILEEYGISDIIESKNGKRRIVSERVQCDLYDYLSGREEYSQLFKGSYLTNYSWAETTLGELTGGQNF